MERNVLPLTPRHIGGTQPSAPANTDCAVYTVAEVAHLLSLALGGTYALIRNGEIPAIKLGARWVIPKARFHTWLDNLAEASDEDVEYDRQRHERKAT